MQHCPVLVAAARRARFKNAVDIGLGYGPAGGCHLCLIKPRGEAPPPSTQHNPFDLQPRHPLSCIDGQPDGRFRGIHIYDYAALDTARALMSNPKNPAAMGAPAQGSRSVTWIETGYEADDFRGAYVEHGKNGAF